MSATTRPDLVEFLRARLDEDAGAAHRFDLCPYREGSGACDENGDPDLHMTSEWWLAEVEWKRRIIEQWEYSRPNTDGFNVQITTSLEWVMGQMIQQYADHPDFDPDWDIFEVLPDLMVSAVRHMRDQEREERRER
jgi:hypothetical protein